tara:strand:- start:137 stop:271 length:135 start_codon:yes stop_codon:yes gene_type:complete
MNDAIKNVDLNFAYSYLFISKKNLLNEKYVIIKKTIFKELEKIK